MSIENDKLESEAVDTGAEDVTSAAEKKPATTRVAAGTKKQKSSSDKKSDEIKEKPKSRSKSSSGADATAKAKSESDASNAKSAKPKKSSAASKKASSKSESDTPVKKTRKRKNITDELATDTKSAVNTEFSTAIPYSPIFSKPIFVYKDETAVHHPTPVENVGYDGIVEVNDEALEMLLDLKFDDEDDEASDEQPLSEMFDLELHTEVDELAEEIKLEEIAAESTETAAESTETAAPSSEEQNEESATEEPDATPIDESSDVSNESEPSNELDDAAENPDIQESEDVAEETEIQITAEDDADTEESSESLSEDATEESSEESDEDEPEEEITLPPLMDIEHFSDYRSKAPENTEDDEETDLTEQDSLEDTPIPSMEASPDDDVENADVQFESEFQQAFFEDDDLTTTDGEAKNEEPQKAPKAEPKEFADEKKYDPEKPRRIDRRFDFVELFVFTLAVIMVLTTFVFRHSIVEGSSMEQTLYEGEHLIISDLFYTPKAGDIVVCEDYSTGHYKPLIKRVIATEGQTVATDQWGNVYVDGKRIKEDYVYVNGHDEFAVPNEWVIPEGEVFVLGDHRNLSSDSRSFGTVSEDSILGKVILRIYPFDRFGPID